MIFILKKTYAKVIDFLSFNSRIRELADLISRKAEQTKLEAPDLISHPGGFTRMLQKRRIGIAEAYIRIAHQLGKENAVRRLHALKILVDLSLHAKTVKMPLNTARVQIEIMKEAVKNIENRRKQMEMVADFTLASYGHEAVIRRFLKQLKRIEVPETGNQLKDLDLGWDSHAHDNLSEGRKNPAQVLIDAFVKGISSLTIAYFDISEPDIIYEAMEAGRILGIDVSIGIEFSVGKAGHRTHYMYIPAVGNYREFFEFFLDHSDHLQQFVNGLEENSKRRRLSIINTMEHFNKTQLVRMNEGYPENDIFSMTPLKMYNLEKLIAHRQYSRNHLAQLLYSRFSKILKNRVVARKLQYEIYKRLRHQGNVSSLELENIQGVYYKERKEYEKLNPVDLGEEYFTGKKIIDYDSVFESESDILPLLSSVGGAVAYNRPLEEGIGKAVLTIVNWCQHIDRIELMNMNDAILRNPYEAIKLARFIDLINNGEPNEVENYIEESNLKKPDKQNLKTAVTKYHETPLIPIAASDSTGWKPHVPGTGFIKESSITKKSRRHFIQNHYRLPEMVSYMIATGGKRNDKVEQERLTIYSLGRISKFRKNLVGDEETFEWIGPVRFWRYLNPTLKDSIRLGIGFIPAYYWIGPMYAFLWFALTFSRNVLVDLISSTGSHIGSWSVKSINFDNAFQSLFWTGFSVPFLSYAKQGFDIVWPLAHAGPLFEWAKFFTICIANGAFISTHNTIRKFDKRVVRGNFFRSILAWPLASIFAPIGNYLMVPSIVQAKFWSEVVAAMIEGIGKFRQKIAIRRRDLLEILPLIYSEERDVKFTAMLDILYIWSKRARGRSCLDNILRGKSGFFETILFTRKKDEQSSDAIDDLQELIDNLLNLFHPQRVQSELSEFILKRYDDYESLALTKLAAENTVAFYTWLMKYRIKIN